MVHTLGQFAMAEKAYNSLGFLEQKWFGRSKDTLRTAYLTLLQELRKIEETVRQQESLVFGLPGPTKEFEILLSHLCGQLCEYIRARQKTMDFFEQISTMGTNKNMNYEDLVNVISEIVLLHSKNFHHPFLADLKSGFTYECDTIQHLLMAQIQMSEGRFLASLLQLHQAHSKLTSWGSAAQARETTKRGMFGSTSKTVSSLPALFSWLLRYKHLLVAKFSLYFYEVLSKQTTSADMRSLSMKNCEDYVAKISAFHRKSDVAYICLYLDSQGMAEPFKGLGYHHPDKPPAPDGYHAIFSYPVDIPPLHWPTIEPLLSGDKDPDPDRVRSHCDKVKQSTYFVVNVEPRIFLTVICETKKSEKDSNILNFMLEMSTMLRCMKHFKSLKPGAAVGGSRK
ncbi:KICSTOR subunit 2-like isoform X2 [Dreissena polymorpha]|nr:KICSTOR subunit 2-like isoform X2 [Dreissena polymorpha]XP_052251647.1 KICSTOR subunit 2-like isoform X2 [Dreissena polymorpha]